MTEYVIACMQSREEAERWSNDAWRPGGKAPGPGRGGLPMLQPDGNPNMGVAPGRGRPGVAQAKWEDAPVGSYDSNQGRVRPGGRDQGKEQESDWRPRADVEGRRGASPAQTKTCTYNLLLKWLWL